MVKRGQLWFQANWWVVIENCASQAPAWLISVCLMQVLRQSQGFPGNIGKNPFTWLSLFSIKKAFLLFLLYFRFPFSFKVSAITQHPSFFSLSSSLPADVLHFHLSVLFILHNCLYPIHHGPVLHILLLPKPNRYRIINPNVIIMSLHDPTWKTVIIYSVLKQILSSTFYPFWPHLTSMTVTSYRWRKTAL